MTRASNAAALVLTAGGKFGFYNCLALMVALISVSAGTPVKEEPGQSEI